MEQQYALARKCGISPIDSNMLPDFEREIFINILLKEMEAERKAMD